MDKRFLAILAVITIAFGGFFIITKSSNDDGGSTASNASPTNNIFGKGEKGVTFTEYGDFQCPVCAAYYGPLKEAKQKYEKEIFFQYRHLPLTSIHPNAVAAARASEAAAKQGKFWEMHDKLFENQNIWKDSSGPLAIFKTYAQDIGLNMQQFESDFASQEINDAINADLQEFKKTGRQESTPSFFINGQPVENSELSNPETGRPDLESISKRIDTAIAEQNQQ